MAKVTAKLVASVVTRGEELPTQAARDALMGLMGLALRREPWTTRADMAKRWSVGEERLVTALKLLRDYKLISFPTDPLDARRQPPQLNLALIEQWVDGSYELAWAGNERADYWGDIPEKAGHLEADIPQNAGLPRARASSSSFSSSISASAIAADVAAARQFEDRHKRAVQSFRDWGVYMPRNAQRALWDFMRLGIQFEDAEEVAQAMFGAGTKAWNYAVKCFEARLRESADGRVRTLLRDWNPALDGQGVVPDGEDA